MDAGNRRHAKDGPPRRECSLDGLRAEEWPTLVRGDRRCGTERVMGALKKRGQDYLFKLAMRKGVEKLVSRLTGKAGDQRVRGGSATGGLDAESAGGGVETVRRGEAGARDKALQRNQLELPFKAVLTEGRKTYECSVPAKSLELETLGPFYLYCD